MNDAVRRLSRSLHNIYLELPACYTDFVWCHMKTTRVLFLGQDPAVSAAFLAQVEQARPGKYIAYTAHSTDGFQTIAQHHKADIQVVVLGAEQTEEDVAAARSMTLRIWSENQVPVLRLPPRLLTIEGRRGGMMRWFLEHMEGPIEGECGCC